MYIGAYISHTPSPFFSFVFSWCGIFALARLTSGGGGGGLLLVSISDLVRSLGSTKGWVPFFSSFGCLFQLVFLSLSFCSRQIIPCLLSTAQRHISVGDFPFRSISQGAPPARLHSIPSMSQTPENGLVV